MYKVPSRRKHKITTNKPNLIPILDSVFIFIFFLLMSASFLKLTEIPSDVPLVSHKTPPSKKKPLALTLVIRASSIAVQTGVPSKTRKVFRKKNNEYPLGPLHDYLVKIKERNVKEKSIVFIPKVDLTYEEIVKLMDTAREVKETDTDIYEKKDGIDVRIKTLFDNVVFGNLQS